MASKLNTAMAEATAQDAATPTEATPEEPPHTAERRRQWESLVAAKHEWKRRAEEAQARFEAQEQRTQLQEDTERVTAKLDSAEGKLAKALVERDPRFQAKFDAPISAARAEVERLVNADEFLDDTEREWILASLLEHQPGAWRTEEIKKVIDYADMDSGTAILSAIRQYDAARAAREKDLTENATTAARHMAKASLDAQFAQRQQQAQELETLITKAREVAMTHEWFQPSETDAEQDKFARESMAELERFWRGQLSADELLQIQPKAAAYEWLLPKFEALKKEQAELEEAIKSYEAVNTFHRQPVAIAPGHLPHESGAFLDAVQRAMGRTPRNGNGG